jgi:sugar phosphate isomerase/epimerase
MPKFGCPARYFNYYKDEVAFAKTNCFDLLQIWYDNQGLNADKTRNPQEVIDNPFPAIIHAVLDINDFEKHIPILKELLIKFNHQELIIHPVCKSENITDETTQKLSNKIKSTLKYLSDKVTVYLENNSKLDPIFSTSEEIKLIFEQNPTLEFLLDIAHIDSYEHLKAMMKIKQPKILHIADKHFNVIHEHLPIGEGELDFKLIFEQYLKDFEGRIILETTQSDEALISAKTIVENILRCNTCQK